MAAGPGARNADGAHVPMGVEVGDKVLLPGIQHMGFNVFLLFPFIVESYIGLKDMSLEL